MVIGIALSIYLPALFIKPEYDFLYSIGGDYSYRNEYVVENGQLIKKPITLPNTIKTGQEPELYVHDVSENASTKVSFEEAQNLNLDSNPQSPDGFEITYGSTGDGIFPIFFWSERDYGSRYIKGHGVSKKLNLQLTSSFQSYYNDLRFLGWVKK
ncbi:MAG: Uncharacterized protein G01um101420_839 [Parcubacteria group bacterium Gr01-1014_20]|nr:MAG: Uncharacterized protein G01um101420_839 [Parcubacteria group bacterium Gr01-1014_20]